ncbi:MAG TPA: PLP-dependent aminotransferase family protein [Segeticoccus sp.]|uniref:aminotransferase-like domain-containing protein n=1 Tax=Segeticoccus sp. TaxID=2706531 RepID=UPI002D802B73|nr:PLP-dependent aminotransferase family protein [Segeticoccus sp.]HET8600884.1 PLP-dependent aminotransferase family protein [Segeticoccus sp.]
MSVQGSRLDPWRESYAERTAGMTASEIRALFAVASRPEVVSLAGGMPYLPALPMDAVAETVQHLIATQGMTALQYGSGQGHPDLREHILEVMALEGIEAHADDVVVTTGSQQALDLVTRVFIDPGDVILAEAPSYVGALGVFSSYQAEVVHVASDDEGLVPAALEERITALEAAGKRIKLLYSVPNFHNPAGTTLALERRPQILEICQRHHILVLEDNPYGLLGFDRDPWPAMRSLSEEGVVYLGSFSKTFAPGLRVGWAVAPHAVREKLVLASESAILCPSNLAQMSISTYLSNNDWRGQIKVYRELYRERRDAMLGALESLLPEATWTHPDGGFYVWLTLPEGLDAKAMLPRAVTERVAFVPGTAFFADGSGAQHMRLSYCYPESDRIREGVRRLAGVIRAELEVRETFEPGTSARPSDRGVQFPGPEQP